MCINMYVFSNRLITPILSDRNMSRKFPNCQYCRERVGIEYEILGYRAQSVSTFIGGGDLEEVFAA